MGALFRTQGMRNPTPRMQMLDGFNQGWLSFEGGEGVEAVTGTTTLEAVVRVCWHAPEEELPN